MYSPYSTQKFLNKNAQKKQSSTSIKKVSFNNTVSFQTKKEPSQKKAPRALKKNRDVLQNLNKDPNLLVIPYLKKMDKKVKKKKKHKNESLNPKEKTIRRFNKLYGLNDHFLKTLKTVKHEKNELDLPEYQNQLLNASTNLSRENILRLYTNFKSLKTMTDTIHPLPPVNFDAIYRHSYRENEKKIRQSLKNEINNKQELDEFELEQAHINKGKYLKLTKENPTMYKIYQILPEHVIDALYKKKNIK